MMVGGRGAQREGGRGDATRMLRNYEEGMYEWWVVGEGFCTCVWRDGRSDEKEKTVELVKRRGAEQHNALRCMHYIEQSESKYGEN